MRRMNNLVTLFTAMTAFFFGSFITTILTTVDKCPAHRSGVAKLAPHPELFLIVLILSAPNNIEKRVAIRETWLSFEKALRQPYFPEDFIYLPEYDKLGFLQLESVAEQANNWRLYTDWLETLHHKSAQEPERKIKVKHFFGIGTANMDPTLRAELEREQRNYNDMLLLPKLVDAYSNLTEKMLHAIDALTHHYDFSYLLKTDDDTYVKLDNLLNELVSYDRKLLRRTVEYREKPVPQLYWGYFAGHVNIKTKGQWKETNYFLAQRYISYALGGGYVLSRKLCEYVANNSNYLATYVSEDVSMGTWLAPLRHVYRKHDPRFDTGYMPRKCRRQHLVLHKRTEKLMRDLFKGELCTFELPNEPKFKRIPEYYYDWRKPADKCCDNIVI